jgi:hypothetical protein
MNGEIAMEVAGLAQMTVARLRERYSELFGEPALHGNKSWLRKRIAWRLQALAEGGLSERARRRAAELACDADLRLSPPRQSRIKSKALRELIAPAVAHDPRLPAPGTVLVRKYKGHSIQVKVLAEGFEYEAAHFESLSAVAGAITGGHCNGFLFFRLARGKRAAS